MAAITSTPLSADRSNDAMLINMTERCAECWRRADRMSEEALPGIDEFEDLCQEAYELEEQIKLASIHTTVGFEAKCKALDKGWIHLDRATVFQLGRDTVRLGITDVSALLRQPVGCEPV